MDRRSGRRRPRCRPEGQVAQGTPGGALTPAPGRVRAPAPSRAPTSPAPSWFACLLAFRFESLECARPRSFSVHGFGYTLPALRRSRRGLTRLRIQEQRPDARDPDGHVDATASVAPFRQAIRRSAGPGRTKHHPAGWRQRYRVSLIHYAERYCGVRPCRASPLSPPFPPKLLGTGTDLASKVLIPPRPSGGSCIGDR